MSNIPRVELPHLVVSERTFLVSPESIYRSESVARVICGDDDHEREEIAEFIARACNAHYDLLEALGYARGIVADQLGEDSAHLRPLDAAIAKAKGAA